jgi:hypothetical protein
VPRQCKGDLRALHLRGVLIFAGEIWYYNYVIVDLLRVRKKSGGVRTIRAVSCTQFLYPSIRNTTLRA